MSGQQPRAPAGAAAWTAESTEGPEISMDARSLAANNHSRFLSGPLTSPPAIRVRRRPPSMRGGNALAARSATPGFRCRGRLRN